MPNPRLDLARSCDREIVAVLAHHALVIGGSLGVVARDTDYVPIVGHLARIIRIEPQRASPHLMHGGGGGDAGQVDKYVDGLCVPTLPKQSARAQEAAAATLLEIARDQGHVQRWRPRPARGFDLQLRLPSVVLAV